MSKSICTTDPEGHRQATADHEAEGCDPGQPLYLAAQKVRWHFEPNLGFESNEPSLSSLIYRHYMTGLGCTIEEGSDWTCRYMDALDAAHAERDSTRPEASRSDDPKGSTESKPVAEEPQALRIAAGQASFCLRQLLPDDPDAQMTVRMLDAALAASSGDAT